MASPFEYFRKRQAGMMVVMVILSMLLFTLDALFTQQDSNFWLLGLLVGGAVFGVAGMGSGNWLKWGLGGAVLGSLLGFILPGFVVRPGAIATTFGVITDEDFADLRDRRVIANRFLGMAVEESLGQGASRFAPQFGFNHSSSREELLFGRMMQEEADALGIVVTDDMVNEYLKESTNRKLTGEAFAKIRTSLVYQQKPLGEDTLYDVFREQIKAQMAYRALRPDLSVGTPPPDVYWEYFRRLNVRQQLNLTKLDIDAFLDQVDEPSDAEIEEVFAAHKQQFPNQEEPGSPGFRLPQRGRMAWLELDYDSVEASLPAITDEEVEAFYNEHRETRYKIPVIPDDDEEEEGENKEDDSRVDADEAEVSADEEPTEDNASKENTDTSTSDTDDADEANGDEAADSSEADTDAADSDAANEANGTSDPLIIPAKPDGEDQKSDPLVEYEYRELDDELKDEIREELLQQKTREAIDTQMQAAEKALMAIAGKRTTKQSEIAGSNPRKYEQLGAAGEAAAAELRAAVAKMTPELLQEMKEYAETSGMNFVETPFVSYQEFRNPDDYPLGAAADPSQQGFNPQGQADAAATIFGSFSDDPANNAAQLFLPRRAAYLSDAEDGVESHYVYCAVDFSPSHVPTLEEPGVRENVILTLKRRAARELLKQRAEELVKEVQEGLAKEGDDHISMAESLEGETITGSDDSATLKVGQTDPFSWMRTSQAAPMSFQSLPRAEVSRIRFSDGTPPLEGLNRKFYETIFDDLRNEEVGIVPNYDLSQYYIVHVTNRFPTPDTGTDGLMERFAREGRLRFATSPVSSVMQGEILSPAIVQWERTIFRKYDVPIDNPQ